MRNKVRHFNGQPAEASSVDRGEFFYHKKTGVTYISVNSNLIECGDRGVTVPNTILFSLEDGIVFSLNNTFGGDTENGGRDKFAKVTNKFQIKPA